MVTVLLLLVAVGHASLAEAAHGRRAPAPAKKKRTVPAPVPLVWHVETVGGAEVSTLDGDLPINPASVVKVATSLWALETLGPAHRFDTVFAAAGSIDAASGELHGDLVVRGSGDPDFMVENAFLVAARLNQEGIRIVTGSLRVDYRFWIGWEGGSERRLADPRARAEQMAQRLRAALDPKRWTAGTRATWQEFATRYSLPPSRPPTVEVRGGAAGTSGRGGERALFAHRSKTLAETLRRFDAFSNNDIERLGTSLGSPDELVGRLADAWRVPQTSIRLETLSGLGSNRLSPRLVVRLLRDFRETTTRLGIPVESILPVAGCDPGTLRHSFAPLTVGPNAMSVAAKTGTLTATDGGTAVLAGFVNTAKGDLLFCVAAPSAAGKLTRARRQQADWLAGLIARSGGPRARRCSGPLASAEAGASIVPAAALARNDSRRAAP